MHFRYLDKFVVSVTYLAQAKFAHLKHITASDDIYNVIVSTDYNVIFNSDPNTKATIPQLKVKLQKLQVTPGIYHTFTITL
jgi:hypothetical protein